MHHFHDLKGKHFLTMPSQSLLRNFAIPNPKVMFLHSNTNTSCSPKTKAEYLLKKVMHIHLEDNLHSKFIKDFQYLKIISLLPATEIIL